MSLAQEPGFRPKNPFRKKLAVDMPTRNLFAAERYKATLRDKFYKSNKQQKLEIYELLSEALLRIMQNASGKNKRNFSKVEQTNFFKIARVYLELKQEFANEVL